MPGQIEIHRTPELIDRSLAHVSSCALPVMKHIDGWQVVPFKSDPLEPLRQVRLLAVEEVRFVEESNLLERFAADEHRAGGNGSNPFGPGPTRYDRT